MVVVTVEGGVRLGVIVAVGVGVNIESGSSSIVGFITDATTTTVASGPGVDSWLSSPFTAEITYKEPTMKTDKKRTNPAVHNNILVV